MRKHSAHHPVPAPAEPSQGGQRQQDSSQHDMTPHAGSVGGVTDAQCSPAAATLSTAVRLRPRAGSTEPESWAAAADSLHADTVGAVVVDAQGRVAAGVSSGGLAMKLPGRVGEAAMYACGCWAADASPDWHRCV